MIYLASIVCLNLYCHTKIYPSNCSCDSGEDIQVIISPNGDVHSLVRSGKQIGDAIDNEMRPVLTDEAQVEG